MKNEPRQKLGRVVNRSGDKTVIVLVERLVKHSRFKKYVKRNKKFHVHDPKNEAAAGDYVKIIECRPVSKQKSWRLHSVIEKAV